MTCSVGVRKNISYNAADVVGAVVRFVQRGKFASSGVHFGAPSDKILRFLQWSSLESLVLRQNWVYEESSLFAGFGAVVGIEVAFVIVERNGKKVRLDATKFPSSLFC